MPRKNVTDIHVSSVPLSGDVSGECMGWEVPEFILSIRYEHGILSELETYELLTGIVGRRKKSDRLSLREVANR